MRVVRSASGPAVTCHASKNTTRPHCHLMPQQADNYPHCYQPSQRLPMCSQSPVSAGLRRPFRGAALRCTLYSYGCANRPYPRLPLWPRSRHTTENRPLQHSSGPTQTSTTPCAMRRASRAARRLLPTIGWPMVSEASTTTTKSSAWTCGSLLCT